MTDRLTQSPALVRVLPFAVFIALTFIQDSAGEAGRYWIYLGKTLAGAVVLFALRKYISELEWRFSIPALVTGIVVFVMWVGIDGWYPTTTDLYSNYICPALKKIGLAKTCEATATRRRGQRAPRSRPTSAPPDRLAPRRTCGRTTR